jgi:hypothetical protein
LRECQEPRNPKNHAHSSAYLFYAGSAVATLATLNRASLRIRASIGPNDFGCVACFAVLAAKPR